MSDLQYDSFCSAVGVGFWHKLAKKKLEVYKLDETAKGIHGSFVNNDPEGLPCRLNVDYSAFDSGPSPHVPHTIVSPGSIVIRNIVEDFKSCDKTALILDALKQIVADVISGAATKNPYLLNRFLILTFADMKKYHFYYWFAFPVFRLKENIKIRSVCPITSKYNTEQLNSLKKIYDNLTEKLGRDPFAFLLKENENGFVGGLLCEWEEFYAMKSPVTIAFSDPSVLPENPGWPLRNLLSYLAILKRADISRLTIICYRDRVREGTREIEHSIVLEMEELPRISLGEESLEAVGWEKNQRGKMGPRMVNLSSTMDPVKLAESAVDLNLKLMRWRLVPDLNLEKIKETKCLLLGSGTLGCNVARSLLGWGVHKITFVDNSNVSFSNPVRQTLFQFDDCLNGGKHKAKAAAESLRRIFPGVDATGCDLHIPMPGHAVSEKDAANVQTEVSTLERLIGDHDAVFLLMDTRESRWLPSVIASSKKKILINAALGFDTFMVMRHGVCGTNSNEKDVLTSKTVRLDGDLLGCYFCNDVVAPGNSTFDRTLDQQCTVSRPGISMMASAMAVELLVSLLQHPLGASAPAETSANDNHLEAEFETPIGIVPHQIRCFLSRFNVVLPACRAFDKCTGCSPAVIKTYEEEGFVFLRRVFDIPKYLEDLTGLTQLHASINDSDIWELSDNDSQ